MTQVDARCSSFIDQIDRLTFDVDDLSAADVLEQLVESLDGVADPSPVFPAIFRFFERNDGVEIGNPGPLVHFIERFYPAYLELLCESVSRAPVEQTVWMLNRILNDSRLAPDVRVRLLELLRRTRDNPQLAEHIREDAAQFLSHQKGAGGAR